MTNDSKINKGKEIKDAPELNVSDSLYGAHAPLTESAGEQLADVNSLSDDAAKETAIYALISKELIRDSDKAKRFLDDAQGFLAQEGINANIEVSEMEKNLVRILADDDLRKAISTKDIEAYINLSKENHYFSSYAIGDLKEQIKNGDLTLTEDSLGKLSKNIKNDCSLEVKGTDILTKPTRPIIPEGITPRLPIPVTPRVIRPVMLTPPKKIIPVNLQPRIPGTIVKKVSKAFIEEEGASIGLRDLIAETPVLRLWFENNDFCLEDAGRLVGAMIDDQADQLIELASETTAIGEEEKQELRNKLIGTLALIYTKE